MRCAFAFSRSTAGQFLVTIEVQSKSGETSQPNYTTTAFEDENLFIERVVLAEIDGDATRDIIAGVLLSVADRLPSNTWIGVDLSCSELSALCLGHEQGSTQPIFREVTLGSGTQLGDVLLQAPVALALLIGPRHYITFINAPYTELLGRKRKECLLGERCTNSIAGAWE